MDYDQRRKEQSPLDRYDQRVGFWTTSFFTFAASGALSWVVSSVIAQQVLGASEAKRQVGAVSLFAEHNFGVLFVAFALVSFTLAGITAPKYAKHKGALWPGLAIVSGIIVNGVILYALAYD